MEQFTCSVNLSLLLHAFRFCGSTQKRHNIKNKIIRYVILRDVKHTNRCSGTCDPPGSSQQTCIHFSRLHTALRQTPQSHPGLGGHSPEGSGGGGSEAGSVTSSKGQRERPRALLTTMIRWVTPSTPGVPLAGLLCVVSIFHVTSLGPSRSNLDFANTSVYRGQWNQCSEKSKRNSNVSEGTGTSKSLKLLIFST